ncbi:pantoate--beta-alanine ligase [Mesobacillus maritimus]|uniref:pantoate--beta-alanine ligase n=1 Tax=Mesobacillus maritimus TaxID=1643336 RepID=UPI00203A47C0|nr:pantoate--beta-alanine ligase [Mesobacillus maritimus]MCM3586529.1 pantoate--beta-alanine ligase [Mesobacillus maritimus]MCM3669439.1 pantoate--beta-alanine ligase [Mesobacillus maritimus]
MNIINTIEEMQARMLELKAEGKKIGFVPTMGYLHEGHMALMKKAKKENHILVASIFVNPLQFGEGEDLDAYPRDFNHDSMIAQQEGVDYLFYPSVKEMYPNKMSVTVTVKNRTEVLCGKSRPGHFDGVATVLTKLFHAVLPDRVYFGLKDAQQVAVVDGLIHDFNFPIELVAVATVREADGLAKSSRNVYLNPFERDQAKELYQSLLLAKDSINKGERDPKTIIELIKKHLNQRCEAKIDYVEVYSYPDLSVIEELDGKIIIALALKFSKARLIDNLILEIV